MRAALLYIYEINYTTVTELKTSYTFLHTCEKINCASNKLITHSKLEGAD